MIPKKIKVTVTAADIKNGKQKRCESCPIALAMQRGYKIKKSNISVVDDIRIDLTENTAFYYHIPEKASLFIRRFDEGEKVNPFTFFATLA